MANDMRAERRDPPSDQAPSSEVTDDELSGLRRMNLLFGLLHLASGLAMVILANDFSLSVTTTFLNGPPGRGVDPARLTTQFDVRLAWGTAAFLFLSAFFHLLIASPLAVGRYRSELVGNRNRFRWVEYSMSATLMIVLIALLVGISDGAALVGIAGVNVAMILFGWLMETTNDLGGPEPVDWSPFVMGCIAGAVPWIAIAVYLFGPGGAVPDFVYVIFFTIFVFFNCFAVNQFLQYRQVGRWRRYVFGEWIYIWLSITAKSALAWQIFGNTLAG